MSEPVSPDDFKISRNGLDDDAWERLNMVVFHLAMIEGFNRDYSDSMALIEHSLNEGAPRLRSHSIAA